MYILELKTTQAAAIKIVVDAINSLLTDANFDFYPYTINNQENEENSEKNDSSDNDEEN